MIKIKNNHAFFLYFPVLIDLKQKENHVLCATKKILHKEKFNKKPKLNFKKYKYVKISNPIIRDIKNIYKLTNLLSLQLKTEELGLELKELEKGRPVYKRVLIVYSNSRFFYSQNVDSKGKFVPMSKNIRIESTDPRKQQQQQQQQSLSAKEYLRQMEQCQSLEESCKRMLKFEKGIFEIEDVEFHKKFLQSCVSIAEGDKKLSWKPIYEVLRQYLMTSKTEKNSEDKDEKNSELTWYVSTTVMQETCRQFMDVLAKKGEFQQLSKLFDQLSNMSTLPNISQSCHSSLLRRVNTFVEEFVNQLYPYLLQALRISNNEKKGWQLFQKLLNQLNISPTLPLLTQAYLCNAENLNNNYLDFLKEYHTMPAVEYLLEVMHYHIDFIKYRLVPDCDAFIFKKSIQRSQKTGDQLINEITKHINSILYLCNEMLDSYDLHLPKYDEITMSNRLNVKCIPKQEFDIVYALLNVVVNEVARCFNLLDSDNVVNKSASLLIHRIICDDVLSNILPRHYIHLDPLYLQLLFKGCLDCNDMDLANQVWKHCQARHVIIDHTSQSFYQRLVLRRKQRSDLASAADTEQAQEYPLSLIHVPVQELLNDASQPIPSYF
ncbi:hypothetical protein RFI_13702, partial [Reticulomyxa filosa]